MESGKREDILEVTFFQLGTWISPLLGALLPERRMDVPYAGWADMGAFTLSPPPPPQASFSRCSLVSPPTAASKRAQRTGAELLLLRRPGPPSIAPKKPLAHVCGLLGVGEAEIELGEIRDGHKRCLQLLCASWKV